MLHADYPALVLFDNFKGQCTNELLTILDNNNNINIVLIPTNCSNPLDIRKRQQGCERILERKISSMVFQAGV